MSRINPVKDYVAVDVAAADFISTAGFNAVWVGTTGDVNMLKHDGTSVIVPKVPGGFWTPMQGKGILKNGTTATGLLVAFS